MPTLKNALADMLFGTIFALTVQIKPFFLLFTVVSVDDLIRTAILATVGAVVSFTVSLGLRKLKHRSNDLWKKLFIILLGLSLVSCNKKLTNVNKSNSDTLYSFHYQKERLVPVPGATVYKSLDLDSLRRLLASDLAPTRYKPIVIKDTSNRTELRFYKDGYGRLQLECETKDRMYTALDERMGLFEKRVSHKVEEITKVKQPANLYFILIGLIIIVVFQSLLIFKFLFK